MARFNIGDAVRIIRNSRHGTVKAGSVGTVMEINATGSKYTDGIVVEFMILPSPQICRIFGKDPTAPEPYRFLFGLDGRNLAPAGGK